MHERENHLDSLVKAVLTGPKYKNICEEVIRNIGSQELVKRRSLKEAIKATRNKLHQVAGAYLDSGVYYPRWLNDLRAAAQSAHAEDLRVVCKKIMHHHSSTRERLKILDEFYSTALAGLTPIRSVLDIACGLNPLAIPWMPLSEDVAYYACDIYKDMMAFLGEFMALFRIKGDARACDVIRSCPSHKVDVAFVLKAIPCLEQVEKEAGSRLLESIRADHLLVTFPVHSLSGRDRGMFLNYETHFRDMVASKSWTIERFEFASELAFLVSR